MRTEPLLRVETDPAAAFTFLQINEYPHWWSLEDLAQCIVFRIMDPTGALLGYGWGEWESPGVMAFHGCAARGRKFPLFSSSMFARLCDLAFAVGADRLTTNVSLSPNQAVLRRLHRRLGLEVGGEEHTLNLWNLHGQEEDKHDRRVQQ